MIYNKELIQEPMSKTEHVLVNTVQDEIELSKKIKPNHYIKFRTNIFKDGSISGHKGIQRQVVDKVVKVYPYFVRTQKGFCVQYVDIYSYGH